ncbi:hypothetical protein Tcan_18566 [Toxocara canis]|uniref:Ig-like domain-containing protein n=1 Tax=Toxocara canis TaxID=6265 RepID=A0A0B2UW37_TOXCA|nr:hypothetical protein Tcan_18566 [Toxocara canis]
MLEWVDLSNNLLGVLRWQSVALARSLLTLVLNGNPLECDCRNEWLKRDLFDENGWHPRELFHLPIRIVTDRQFSKCTFNDCQIASLQPFEAIIDAQLGASIELICDLFGTDELSPSKYATFEWVYANSSYIQTSATHINNRSLSVRIENVTSNEMGIVICKCWSCRMPLFGIIQRKL